MPSDASSIADVYVPLTLHGEVDWSGADQYVWNRLIDAVSKGDVSAMRAWISARRGELVFDYVGLRQLSMSDAKLAEFVARARQEQAGG